MSAVGKVPGGRSGTRPKEDSGQTSETEKQYASHMLSFRQILNIRQSWHRVCQMSRIVTET